MVDEWLEVVDADAPEERALILNAHTTTATAFPRLTDHDGEGWHLHYRDRDDDLAHILRAVFGVGTALHLTTRGMNRLGRCRAPGCDHAYADVSRNGTQRYCSARCGSRDAVRRHRARTRTV